jgi:DNA-damage-inducible protein J
LPDLVVLKVQVSATIKKEASAVLAEMGLTVSDVVRIVLTRVAKDKVLPFDMYMPNKLTAETIEKSELGVDVYSVKDANDLFNKLRIG